MTSGAAAPRTHGGVPRLYGSPRVPSWLVPRPQLVRALDTDVPLVVVTGPPGGGKSVALAEWARASTDSHLRGVVLDLGGRPLSRVALWSQVSGLLLDAGLVGEGRLFSSGADSLRELADVRAFLVRAFTQLAPLTLVLDGADRLDDESAGDLVHVLDAVPGVRAVVAGRSLPALASGDVRLRLDVATVDGDDLALTVEETAAVLGLDVAAATAVRRATGGSPLATRVVALERDQPGVDPGQALETVVLAAVAHLDPETVDLLRCAATADVVSPELATTLTGRDGAPDTLEHVADLGLGTWVRAGADRAFVCTPVVRIALRAELRRTDPGRFARLRWLVARWCDTHDRPVEALEAAVDADDVDLVNTVVRHHWRAFLSQYAGTVQPTVSPLGLTRLRHHPVLLFFVGLGHNAHRGGRLKALALFGLAITSARTARRSVPPEERLVLRVVEMIALRLTGRADAAAAAADDVARRVDELEPARRAEIQDLLPQVHAHSGVTYLRVGRSHDAVAAFERGVGEASSDLATLPNLALLAGAHALDGSLQQAAAVVADAQTRTWPDGWVEGYTGSLLQVAQAVLALDALDVVEAQRRLDLLDRHLATIEHWAPIAEVQAHVDLLTSGADAALTRLQATRDSHRQRRSKHAETEAALDATQALLLVAAGRPYAVLTGDLGPVDHPAVAVSLARAQCAAGLPEQALGTLAGVAGSSRASVRTRAEAALVEAVALLAVDHEVEARSALARATGILSVHALHLPLALLPADDRARLRTLAEQSGTPVAVGLLAQDWPETMLPGGAVAPLTSREAVILRELASTGSTSVIAERLVVSPHTVKSQLRTLYRKLGVTSRASALAVARRYGLLEADAPDDTAT